MGRSHDVPETIMGFQLNLRVIHNHRAIHRYSKVDKDNYVDGSKRKYLDKYR